MQSSLVKPTAFYSCESEKTKLNWFCYEYASDIVSDIDDYLRRRLKRKGVTDQHIADFAVGFSRHMKAVVIRRIAGEFDAVPMSYRDIERFFPQLDDRLVNDLLTVVAAAWENLLDLCSACPTRCISEANHPTRWFDAPNL